MLPNRFVTRVLNLYLRLPVRCTSSVSRLLVWAPLEQVTSLKLYCTLQYSCILQRPVSFTVVRALFAMCLSIDVRFLGLSGMACGSIDGRCAFYFWSLIKANGCMEQRIGNVLMKLCVGRILFTRNKYWNFYCLFRFCEEYLAYRQVTSI